MIRIQLKHSKLVDLGFADKLYLKPETVDNFAENEER